MKRLAVVSPVVFSLLAAACSEVPAASNDAASPAIDAAPALDAAAADASAADTGASDTGPRDAFRPDTGLPPGLARYPLTATFPESATFDPTLDAFFVGSLGDGSVHRVDRTTGAETVFFTETEPGTWWSLGMDVDVARRRLWVCAMDDQRETTSETPPYAGWIWVFDLDTGARVARRDLSSVGVRATCTDVAVAADGSAYVSDRESPRVYHLTETGPVATLVENDLLDAAVVGENAIVVLPDQSALLVLIYLPSRLVRIDLGDLHVSDVAIDGTFGDFTPAASGADGMTLSGDRLLVAFTSEVDTLAPTLADWSAATIVSAVDVPAGMTDVVHTPDGDYLSNGQSVQFAFGGSTDPFALVRFEQP